MAEAAGKIVSIKGVVQAETPEGVRPLSLGSEVYPREIITTGPESHVEIAFRDGTLLSQSAASELSLDEYIFDAQDETSSSLFFEMAKGTFRTISGEIAEQNPEEFNLETPITTIGIRGTGLFIVVDEDGQTQVGVTELKEGHEVFVQSDLQISIISAPGNFVFADINGNVTQPEVFSVELLNQIQLAAPITLIGETPSEGTQVLNPEETPEGSIEEGEEGDSGEADEQAGEDQEVPEEVGEENAEADDDTEGEVDVEESEEVASEEAGDVQAATEATTEDTTQEADSPADTPNQADAIQNQAAESEGEGTLGDAGAAESPEDFLNNQGGQEATANTEEQVIERSPDNQNANLAVDEAIEVPEVPAQSPPSVEVTAPSFANQAPSSSFSGLTGSGQTLVANVGSLSVDTGPLGNIVTTEDEIIASEVEEDADETFTPVSEEEDDSEVEEAVEDTEVPDPDPSPPVPEQPEEEVPAPEEPTPEGPDEPTPPEAPEEDENNEEEPEAPDPTPPSDPVEPPTGGGGGGSAPPPPNPTPEEPGEEDPTPEEPGEEDPTPEEPGEEDPTPEEPGEEDPTPEGPSEEEGADEPPEEEEESPEAPTPSPPPSPPPSPSPPPPPPPPPVGSGTTGNDSLVGTTGADTFTLLSGDDTVDGLAGNDTIEAASYLDGSDLINGGADIDELRFTDNGSGTDDMDGVSNVEKVVLGDAVTDVTLIDGVVPMGSTLEVDGSALSASSVITFDGSAETDDGFIFRGGAANDSLTGGGGDDYFYGVGGGADSFDGNGGVDTVDYSDDIAGINVSFNDLFVVDGNGNTDNIFGIEGVVGSNFADTMGGGPFAADLQFEGRAGNDIFNMEDQLTSADVIDGGADSDTLNFQGDASGSQLDQITNVENIVLADSIDTQITTQDSLVAAGELLTVDASAIIVGNSFTFDASAETDGSFEITGAQGGDDITLGTGDDSVSTGDSSDTVRFDANLTVDDDADGGAGTDFLYYTDDGASTNELDNVRNFEFIFFGDATTNVTLVDDFVATGDSVTMNGQSITSGTITIDGSAETDGDLSLRVGGPGSSPVVANFIGGAGADQLIGAAGADTFEGNAGNDQFFGGTGIDTVTYLNDPGTGITTTYSSATAASVTDTYGDTDTLDNIEVVEGSAFADTFNLATYLDGTDLGVDGAGGVDTLNYTPSTSSTDDLDDVTSIEILNITDPGTNYVIATLDSLVSSGQTLTVTVNAVPTPTNDMIFDGSAETDGAFNITGPTNGASTYKGGAGSDTFTGNGSNTPSRQDTLDYSSQSQAVTLTGTTGGSVDDGRGGTDSYTDMNRIIGSTGDDVFDMQSGSLFGLSEINMENGDDTLKVSGMGLSNGPSTVNGGSGTDDILEIYSIPTSFNLDAVTAFETIKFKSSVEDVDIFVLDSLVASGQTATIDASNLANGDITFNGASETDGNYFFKGSNGGSGDSFIGGAGDDEAKMSNGNNVIDMQNGGNDTVDGGHKADVIFMGTSLDENDHLNGNEGLDTLHFTDSDGTVNDLENVYSFERIVFGDAQTNIAMNSSSDDNLISAGHYMTLDAENLTGSNYISFDGTEETDGWIIFHGSSQGDTFVGGDYKNYVNAGAGVDDLTGGGSASQKVHNYLAFEFANGSVNVDLAITSGEVLDDGFNNVEDVSNFGNIVGSQYDDTLRGDSDDNIIATKANSVGQEISYDADFVEGRAGDDALLGVEGSGHTLSYESATGGINADLSTGSVSDDGYGDTDTVTGFANVIGSDHADIITGNSGNNIIAGGNGADTLDGTTSGFNLLDFSAETGGSGITYAIGAANVVDTYGNSDNVSNFDGIIGSANADSITGNADDNGYVVVGTGNTFAGGGGQDTLSFEDFSSAKTVNMVTGSISNMTGSNDFERVIGGSAGDTITGDANANWISGGEAADTLDGGGGIDTLYFSDTLAHGIKGYANQGVIVDLSASASAVVVDDGFGATDTSVTNFENVFGTVHGDTITGDTGANKLEGDEGDDTLQGGGGIDELFGGDGDDTIDGGDGVDATLDGGDGSDTLTFAGATVGVTASTSAGTVTNDGFGNNEGSVLANVENLRGTQFVDNLTVDEGGIAEGMNEADTLSGTNSTLGYFSETGGSGLNYTIGSATVTDTWGQTDTVSGFNSVIGSQYNDTLTGDSGDNTLEGYGGDDTLDGGAGTDTLSFSMSTAAVEVDLTLTSNQVINDGFGNEEDADNFENIIGSVFDDTIHGNDSANVIEGGYGQDNLWGEGGNDTFRYTDPDDGGDLIYDFKSGVDKFEFDSSEFDFAYSGALTSSDFESVTSYNVITGKGGSTTSASFVYDPVGMWLYYDDNGSSVLGGQTRIASFTSDVELESSDIEVAS